MICEMPFGGVDFIVSSFPMEAQRDYSTQIQIVTSLLEAGADPNITDSYGRTPIFCGHRELLLKYGADPNHQDNDGNTPLMLDVNDNLSASLMEALLKNGADPNIANKDGKTALFYHADQTKQNLLLKYGADPDHLDNNRQTYLEFFKQHR